jgi:glycosyltransferase involved in cell wall biosynthesis
MAQSPVRIPVDYLRADDELNASLQDLLADHALRESLGTAGRLHGKKFDWEVITTRWESLFLRQVSQKHTRTA